MRAMHQPSGTQKLSDQRGIISIMVTMILMLVISLIVIGLAQISRRAQRQSLNDQLSTQAFYAAESGVNDAVAALRLRQQAGDQIYEKTSCANDSHYTFNTQLSSDSNSYDVQYTCLTIDPTPPSLTGPLSSSPSVYPLHASDGNPLGDVKLTWTVDKSKSTEKWNKCPVSARIGSHIFSKVADWDCPYGVLRFDLVPATNMTRDGLINDTMTAFVVPTGDESATGITGYSGNIKSAVYPAANCLTACSFDVTGLTATKYYLRVSELYGSGQLTVTGRGGTVKFTDSQVVVDSTGKAQDELRRIRVAVDIGGSNQNTGGSAPLISGESICKRYIVYIDSAQDDSSSYPECSTD